jgi:plasmid stabilization system protein ParE
VKVRLTASAAADMKRIAERIGVVDAARAEALAGQLRRAVRSIGESPRRWAPVTWAPAFRKRSVPPFVLYKIENDEVVIIRVAHERSDWASLL